MNMIETASTGEIAKYGMGASAPLGEEFKLPPIRVDAQVRDKDGNLISEAYGYNLKTTSLIGFLLTQGYARSGAATVGMAYVANSTDTTITETAASTVMANEITTNGLGRALCDSSTITAAAGTAVIVKQFTATGSSTVGKVCLASASTAGTVGHILLLSTPQPLINTNTFTVTFTITLT
jgi:hypothetical protein